MFVTSVNFYCNRSKKYCDIHTETLIKMGKGLCILIRTGGNPVAVLSRLLFLEMRRRYSCSPKHDKVIKAHFLKEN